MSRNFQFHTYIYLYLVQTFYWIFPVKWKKILFESLQSLWRWSIYWCRVLVFTISIDRLNVNYKIWSKTKPYINLINIYLKYFFFSYDGYRTIVSWQVRWWRLPPLQAATRTAAATTTPTIITTTTTATLSSTAALIIRIVRLRLGTVRSSRRVLTVRIRTVRHRRLRPTYRRETIRYRTPQWHLQLPILVHLVSRYVSLVIP